VYVTGARRGVPRPLLNAEKLDAEDECRIGRDGTDTARTVPQLRRDDERPGPSDLHPFDSFVPPRDHAPGAERKDEGFAAIDAAVEDFASVETTTATTTRRTRKGK